MDHVPRLAQVDAPSAERVSSSFDLPRSKASEEVELGNPMPIDKKRLEQFRKTLEARRLELRQSVHRTEQSGRDADQDSTQDVADKAASSYTKEFLFHQSSNERQLLLMVEKALERVREGTFGECIACDKEINAKRLDAVPWTRHCIECQEKLEQGILEESAQ